MCYLKRIKSYVLTYHADEFELGYSNYDRHGCVGYQKVYFWFCVYVWRWHYRLEGKKQDCVAQSTMKAMYVVINLDAKKVVYLMQRR